MLMAPSLLLAQVPQTVPQIVPQTLPRADQPSPAPDPSDDLANQVIDLITPIGPVPYKPPVQPPLMPPICTKDLRCQCTFPASTNIDQVFDCVPDDCVARSVRVNYRRCKTETDTEGKVTSCSDEMVSTVADLQCQTLPTAAGQCKTESLPTIYQTKAGTCKMVPLIYSAKGFRCEAKTEPVPLPNQACQLQKGFDGFRLLTDLCGFDSIEQKCTGSQCTWYVLESKYQCQIPKAPNKPVYFDGVCEDVGALTADIAKW